MEYAGFKEAYMPEFIRMLGIDATEGVLESFCKCNYGLSKKVDKFDKSTVLSNAGSLIENDFSKHGQKYKKIRFLERLYGKEKIPENTLDLSNKEIWSRTQHIFLELPIHESVITFMYLMGMDYNSIITLFTFGSTMLSRTTEMLNENITSADLSRFSASLKVVFSFFKSYPLGRSIYAFITYERSAECDLAFFKFVKKFPPIPELEKLKSYGNAFRNSKFVFLDDYFNEIFAKQFSYVGDRGLEKTKLLRNICVRTRQKIIDSGVLES